MIKISKRDVQHLIKSGLLKQIKGRYPELHITSKQKKSKRKGYYVPDYFAKKIKL